MPDLPGKDVRGDDGELPGSGRKNLGAAASVGILAGFLSGLFGVGGGVLIVPGLVLLMRMDQRRAHGTSLAAIVPIASAGVAGFALHDSVDWVAAALLVGGAAAGVVVGTHALHRLRQNTLRLLFAGLLVVTAVRLFAQTPETTGRGALALGLALGLLGVGLFAGSLAGLLGVGGGIIMVPALVLLFSVPDAIAKGTSLAVIIPTAVVGTWRNLRRHGTDLPVATIVGLLGVASAFAASQLAVNLDRRVSSALFASLLVLVAARLLLTRPVEEKVGAPGPDADSPAPGSEA